MPSKTPPELVDDLDDEVSTAFRPGEYGRVMLTGLIDLVKHYTPPERQDHVLGFVKWVPPDHLERYLVLALKHGADLTRPKETKKPRRKARRGD